MVDEAGPHYIEPDIPEHLKKAVENLAHVFELIQICKEILESKGKDDDHM